MNKVTDKIAEVEFLDIKLGDTREFEEEITEDKLREFAHLSGDKNPLHMDQGYAGETELGGRIAHGMLLSIFFSQLVGIHLPGKHSLYLSQSLRFHKPAKIGTKILIRGTVSQVVPSIHTVKILTEIFDTKNNELLVNGEAMVKLLK